MVTIMPMFTPPSGFSFWDSTGTTIFNPADKSSNIVLTNNNTTVTASSDTVGGVRTNTSHTSGKWYVEFIWTTPSGSSSCCGIANSSTTFANVGNNGTGGAIVNPLGLGEIWINGTREPSTTWLGNCNPGDTIGCAVDLDASLIWFRINAGNWNNVSTNNPTTGTGGLGIPSLTPAFAVVTIAHGILDNGLVNGVFAGADVGDTLPYSIYMIDESGHLWYSHDTGVTWIQTKSSQPIDRYCTDWFSDMSMAVNDGETRKLFINDYTPSIQNLPGVPLMPDDAGPDNDNEGQLGSSYSFMGGLYYCTAEEFSTAPTIWYNGPPKDCWQFYTEVNQTAITANGQIIFAVTDYNYDNYCYADPGGSGTWPFFYYNRISYDAGATWQNVPGLPTDTWFSGIAFSQNANVMYVAAYETTDPSIYKSVDKGHTWNLLSGSPTNLSVNPYFKLTLLCSQDGSIVYLPNYLYVYMSKDGGTTWTQSADLVTSFPGFSTANHTTGSMTPTGSKILFCANTSPNGIGVRLSTDGGITWPAITTVPFTSTNSSYKSTADCSIAPDGLGMVIVHGDGKSVAYGYDAVNTATVGHYYVSTNGGISWTAHQFNLGLINYDSSYYDPLLRCYIVPNGANYKIIMGDVGGNLYVSLDSGVTLTTTTPPINSYPSPVTYPITGPGIESIPENRWIDFSMAINDGDYNTISASNGDVWGVYGGEFAGNFTSFQSDAQAEGYSARSGILIATRSTYSTNPILNLSTNSPWPYTAQSAACSANGTMWVAVLNNGVNNLDSNFGLRPMVSHDGGATWNGDTNFINSMGILPENKFRWGLFALSQNAAIVYTTQYQYQLYRSMDSGVTWTLLANSPYAHEAVRFKCSKDGSIVVILSANGADPDFSLSLDFGDTWQTWNVINDILGTGIADFAGNVDFGMSVDGKTILVCCEYKDTASGSFLPAAWITKDNGVTWTPVTPLIPDGSFGGYMVCSVAPDGLGMVLTYDNSIVDTDSPNFVDVSTDGGITWINRTFQMVSADGWDHDNDFGYFYSAIMVKPTPIKSADQARAMILA